PATGTYSYSVDFTPSGGIGSQTLTATYGGDTDHSGSHGDFSLTVSPCTTLSPFACSPSSVPVNSASTCTATVADTGSGTVIRPGGTVSFSGGSGTFSSGGTCTLPGAGTNSCSVDFTPAAGSEGSQTLTGTYGGDSNHSGS